MVTGPEPTGRPMARSRRALGVVVVAAIAGYGLVRSDLVVATEYRVGRVLAVQPVAGSDVSDRLAIADHSRTDVTEKAWYIPNPLRQYIRAPAGKRAPTGQREPPRRGIESRLAYRVVGLGAYRRALRTSDWMLRTDPGRPVCVRRNRFLLRRWVRHALVLPGYCPMLRHLPPAGPLAAGPVGD